MRTLEISANLSNPPIGALLTAGYVSECNIKVDWGKENLFVITKDFSLDANSGICRYLARAYPQLKLYGDDVNDQIVVDHWLSFSVGPLSCSTNFEEALVYLDKTLEPITYLAGKSLTVADLCVWGSLFVNTSWSKIIEESTESYKNIKRWFSHIKSLKIIQDTLQHVPAELLPKHKKDIGKTVERKDEGKFVELPGAEMGKVVVRFPPEASGFLHIGHAKAALLNQYYQQAFNGKLIMRFDDTNPDKEKVDFEKVILEDIKLLDIKPDLFTHTSSYFDLMLNYCEQLLREGLAYVDDTDPETMKSEREQRQESKNYTNPVEKNLTMWEEMKKGTQFGQKCCVRAKIDMKSDNGCMRDPTIYRCKNEPHPRTGTKYKVYPTYDFACPIVDSIEGVTHALRTMEYHDRDEQFYWFIDALKLRKPYIWEYSRLNMMNTVLSKRKLTWFVQEGIVESWEDPRFPTVRGVLRRGLTVEGLKQFIIAQGSSRSVVQMEWDKIWAFNKKVIDPIVPRYTALEQGKTIVVNVKGAVEEKKLVAKHPKNSSVGEKTMWIGPKVLIDRADAEELTEGKNATFINWGNIKIIKINRNNSGDIVSVDGEANIGDTDYKKTLKLTWLPLTNKSQLTPIKVLYFDHLISKPVLAKDEDFKSYINYNSKKEVLYVGDEELNQLKQNDIIQLQRIGFFRCDAACTKTQPLVLIHIPDGSSKPPAVASFTNNPQREEQNLVPLTDQDLEQIAIQWNVDREQLAKQVQSGPVVVGISEEINSKIVQQGNLVRDLKANKASKADIESAVKVLLGLKADYKSVTGVEWKPSTQAPIATLTKPASPSSNDLESQIVQQGDLIRKLKANKAEKSLIEVEVKTLLGLKTQFKNLTGKDWQPVSVPSKTEVKSVSSETKKVDSNIENDLLQKIADQGNKVRDLKTKKASKPEIDCEVNILLQLKAQFKNATGIDWKPGMAPTQEIKTPTQEVKSSTNPAVEAILVKISEQGNKVRDLKTNKADKSEIDEAVKLLLSLKADYKNLTGVDWKPGMAPTQEVKKPTPEVKSSTDPAVESILVKISEQGNKVRDLKTNKADKSEIDEAVKLLLSLKADYKNITGEDWKPPSNGGGGERTQKKDTSKKPEAKVKQLAKEKSPTKGGENVGAKKQTRLGLEASKEEDLSEWYSQVITKGELIEYYDVSGCYILRPWAFSIWESIQQFFDSEIKKLGVQNCYFPMFVSKAVLEKEKTHIDDFSPEVAWVTKSGDTDLAEHIAIRPTSETVMYPAFAKWVQSYRDLPIKLNQWNSVVRWEFKHPQPFIRTREFLWQEGHTAFASQTEAEEEVLHILSLYERIYTELLAVPVVKGRKTEKEKFAGGDYTTTVEGYISATGRGIQGATSHHLGQNFSKIFDVNYEDPETQEKKLVYQNSWGISTRTIGVMIMVHADNKGLVLPPKVAALQVVIVPCGITVGLEVTDKDKLLRECSELEKDLQMAEVRVKFDQRENYSPGWKFNHWELKGVPIRVELGPKDVEKRQLIAVRRDTGEKITVPLKSAIVDIKQLLETIHNNMLARATQELETHTTVTKGWIEFNNALQNKHIIMSPFCGSIQCEETIKKESARDQDIDSNAPSMGAKSLCIPFNQPKPLVANDICIHPSCKNKPVAYTLFGRSY